MSRTAVLAAGALLLILGIAATLLTRRMASDPPAPVAAPTASQPSPPPSAPLAASAPQIRHPVPAVAAAGPSDKPVDIESALVELLGRKTATSMFHLDDLPGRVVATVDNLGRTHAPSRLWPVVPAAGKLAIDETGGNPTLGADNGLRYTPYVLLLETVDLRHVVEVYAMHYAAFQQAYVDLGYPKGHFNDRLVEVIDLLLATPQPAGPIGVHLPKIQGPLQPQRPWVLYEFDDPALQALPAGQKLLLRTGPVNERRIKARLTQLRQLLTSASVGR